MILRKCSIWLCLGLLVVALWNVSAIEDFQTPWTHETVLSEALVAHLNQHIERASPVSDVSPVYPILE